MDLKAEITCRGCGRPVTILVKEMIPGTSKRCTYCPEVIRFSGDDGRKVQEATDAVKRSLKDLGRKLRL